jgi:hypothetical protein
MTTCHRCEFPFSHEQKQKLSRNETSHVKEENSVSLSHAKPSLILPHPHQNWTHPHRNRTHPHRNRTLSHEIQLIPHRNRPFSLSHELAAVIKARFVTNTAVSISLSFSQSSLLGCFWGFWWRIQQQQQV